MLTFLTGRRFHSSTEAAPRRCSRILRRWDLPRAITQRLCFYPLGILARIEPARTWSNATHIRPTGRQRQLVTQPPLSCLVGPGRDPMVRPHDERPNGPPANAPGRLRRTWATQVSRILVGSHTALHSEEEELELRSIPATLLVPCASTQRGARTAARRARWARPGASRCPSPTSRCGSIPPTPPPGPQAASSSCTRAPTAACACVMGIRGAVGGGGVLSG